MKPYILLFISLFTLLACTKPPVEETTPITTPKNDLLTSGIVAPNYATNQTNPLYGVWYLVKYELGFGPESDYNNSEIQWTFNSNNTVSVVVRPGTFVYNSLPLKTTGVYNYTTSNNNRIILATNTYGYIILNNKLIIHENVASDGKQLTFHRVQHRLHKPRAMEKN